MTGKARVAGAGDTLPDVALVPASMQAPAEEPRTSLYQALLQLKLPQLRAMAAARHVTGRSSQREPLAEALVENMMDAQAQAALVRNLDQPARAILAVARVLQLNQGNLAAPPLGRVLRGRHASSGEIEAALAHLGEVGLLLPVFDGASRHQAYYGFPAAVAAGLIPLLPEIRAYSGDLPAPHGDPDAASVMAKFDALLDALTRHSYRLAEAGPRTYRGRTTWMLGRWEVVGDLPDAPRGRLAVDDRPRGVEVAAPALELAEGRLAGLRAAAGMGSDEEVRFFLFVAEGLDLLGRAGVGLVPFAEKVATFRAQSPERRYVQMIATALQLGGWSELGLLLAQDPGLALFRNATLHYAEPVHMHADVGHIRAALILMLAWLPVGPWYDLPAFLTSLHRLFPELPISLQPKTGGWEQLTWWFERWNGGTPQYLDRRSAPDWMRGLGRLVTAMLTGPLTWLGLVETTTLDGNAQGNGSATPPAGFRLTALGALISERPVPLLGIQPLPAGVAPQPAPTLGYALASPDMLLTLDPRATTLDDRITLAGLAEPIRADSELCIFRLTAGAVRQGFDRGLDLDGVLALLRRLAGDELPPALVERLRGWWAAYGRLRFYTGVTLLSFHDDFTLAELLASTGLSNYLLYQFSPRLVAVANTEVDRLIGELQRAGHMPRVIDEARVGGEEG
ncbi:MAG TPA: helicase-associated domain-containing protein [Chloroflexia bacterium]|nr:helicase-associated domain-containing protein [Chloroflexia bacterium]